MTRNAIQLLNGEIARTLLSFEAMLSFRHGSPAPPLQTKCTALMSQFDDPGYWYARGAEARAIAAEMTDPETKRMMMDVAKTYDRLAQHAERRSKS